MKPLALVVDGALLLVTVIIWLAVILLAARTFNLSVS